MKYHIDLSVRAKGLQLMRLNEDQKECLLEEDLDEIYMDFVDDNDYDFEIENQFLTSDVDRFRLAVSDENDEEVCVMEDVADLIDNDKTYKLDEDGDRAVDEDGEWIPIDGWNFEGVDDGCYLVRVQTIKGHSCEADIELDEPFDASRLYVIQDRNINDELLGDDVFSANVIYYQRGEEPNPETDIIELDFISDDGEQYFDTYLMEVEHQDYWKNLQEEED